jgi:hypothetical protein
MVLSMCQKFQQKQVFRFWDNEFAEKLDFCDLFVKCEYFLEVYYLRKETSVFAETFNTY